jgi:hypothetical protein
MIITRLNRLKNSISLDYTIKNFAGQNSKTLHNKPESVLQEVATQGSQLFGHDALPLDINYE